MSKLLFLVFIIFVIAIIIVVVSLWAYNKRLDKVTSGEIRDTHNKLPEPGTTAGVTYRTVLIILTIIAVLSISSLIGQISSLSSNVTSLQSKLHDINMDLLELQRKVEENGKLTTNLSYEITGADLEKKTATLKFSVDLKQYSDDTKVKIALGDLEFPLTRENVGTYSGQVTADLFQTYDQLKICITEGTTTKVEISDFYQTLFMNVLPLGGLDCNINSKDVGKKTKCNGWYRLVIYNPEKLQKVNVTYLVDGKVYKTFDATTMAKDYAQIELDKDLTIEKDLSLLVETITTDGYKIEKKTILVYRTPIDPGTDEYERIYDNAGNLVWENEKYN